MAPRKFTRHAKKQENTNHNKENNRSTERDPATRQEARPSVPDTHTSRAHEDGGQEEHNRERWGHRSEPVQTTGGENCDVRKQMGTGVTDTAEEGW